MRPAPEMTLPASTQGIRSFAALGDSFTAGTGTETGDCWADRLAASLRGRRPDLMYRNLAWEGATSAQALEQVATAIEIEPDLVSLICRRQRRLRDDPPRPRAHRREPRAGPGRASAQRARAP